MILALVTMLLPAFDNPDEKIFQSNNPEKTKIGYGTPSDGTFKALPKKRENITIIKKG